MNIDALGHVVIRVRDLERAAAFYGELLGIPVSARAPNWSMIFFTLGSHHDFAVAAVGEDGDVPTDKTVGLDHVAFRLSGGLAALREAKTQLEGAGIEVLAFDHVVSKSLYCRDPDGNLVELYVDEGEAWREDPSLILAEGGPLSFETE